MPECVRVDVRQAVTLAEFGKPACYAVRVHRFSVFLRKQESLIVIILPQPQPFRVLPCPVLPKELHRFRWQRNPTIRSRGFGRTQTMEVCRETYPSGPVAKLLDVMEEEYKASIERNQ